MPLKWILKILKLKKNLPFSFPASSSNLHSLQFYLTSMRVPGSCFSHQVIPFCGACVFSRTAHSIQSPSNVSSGFRDLPSQQPGKLYAPFHPRLALFLSVYPQLGACRKTGHGNILDRTLPFSALYSACELMCITWTLIPRSVRTFYSTLPSRDGTSAWLSDTWCKQEHCLPLPSEDSSPVSTSASGSSSQTWV